MGMYDYLNGEQVKIFYTPVFGVYAGKSILWHSGGSLRKFNINDELPLKTIYYKYPDDMIVYAYGYSKDVSEDVWVIKNGISELTSVS